MLTNTICGMRIAQSSKNGKLRNLGKVRSFVFHPTERRVVGIFVKRPDAALMFHRKDAFVRFGAFSLDEEGSGLLVSTAPDAMGARAERAAGINLDECVLWWGMPVVNESGESLGYVNNIDFNWKTGAVNSIEVGSGGVAKTALMGKISVEAKDILGFKRDFQNVQLAGTDADAGAAGADADAGAAGAGAAGASADTGAGAGAGADALQTAQPSESEKAAPVGQPAPPSPNCEDEAWDDAEPCGAILVSKCVNANTTSGGLVQAAGKATAKTKYKIRVVSKDARAKISEKTNITPQSASEAVNKASYTAGEKIGGQLTEARSMFKNFKDEFNRAYNGEGEGNSDSKESDK